MLNMTTDRLDTRRIALFLDIDGTLLDLAPRPTAVIVPPTLVSSLADAQRALGGALAVISGRPLDDIDRLFTPLTLPASGVHGAQTRFRSDAAHDAEDDADCLPRSLWMDLTEILFDFPGTFAENKRFSFAVHYRTAPIVKPRLHAALERLIGRHPELDLEMIHGHSVYELKQGGFDKGTAIGRFMERPPFSGRMPIFIGDDTTDEAGFAAVVDRGGKAFSVGQQRPHVSGVFPRPETVRNWVAKIGRPAS